MHAHLATDQGVHSEACEAVFDHNGKLSCSLPTLKEVFFPNNGKPILMHILFRMLLGQSRMISTMSSQVPTQRPHQR